ncbi:beta-1,3-glucosyltransferase-like [Saccoglossus kowalevskii]|uniref:Beta-1,3-glucosyltransferase-like n=1 Tax=Saccoglossus kowalevskii TaxID=10224 RepID=A0ABM0GK75_SACKO|nr:PREDICTED: beta-1,3-glucosyltransferase-like [Saccoglossus kowalevskii]
MAVNLKCVLLTSLLLGFIARASTDIQGKYNVKVKEIVFIIRSQPHPFHRERAKLVQSDIEQQCRILGWQNPKVILLSDKYPDTGQWVIQPLLKKLEDDFGKSKYKWIFFCEEETRVKLPGLLNVLTKYDPNDPWFLGKELRDQEPTIIHHYKFHNNPSVFAFPDLEAGWLLSVTLLNILSEKWEAGEHHMDFSIDIKHELAIFIWDDGKGIELTHVPELCSGNIGSNEPMQDDGAAAEKMEKDKKNEKRKKKNDSDDVTDCVTSYPYDIIDCGSAVPKKDIYFAVKTCEKFHTDRVPVIKKTWAQHVKHISYYSEKEDKSIPTISTGIPNTERGHCGKTFYIFNHFKTDPWLKRIPWLVITDDDTILSVSRLQRLLSCYNATEPVYLGERYGYGHTKPGWGYDYLTGGGGFNFILSFVYQARPDDYCKSFLQHQTPVSFHKHWNNDPYKVYEDWFSVDDEKGDLVLDIPKVDKETEKPEPDSGEQSKGDMESLDVKPLENQKEENVADEKSDEESAETDEHSLKRKESTSTESQEIMTEEETTVYIKDKHVDEKQKHAEL